MCADVSIKLEIQVHDVGEETENPSFPGRSWAEHVPVARSRTGALPDFSDTIPGKRIFHTRRRSLVGIGRHWWAPHDRRQDVKPRILVAGAAGSICEAGEKSVAAAI